MPSASNLATSVQPSLARTVPPTASTKAAAAGSVRPGLAPLAESTIVTGLGANTERTCSAASSSERSGANR
jgi:hypothetical protein